MADLTVQVLESRSMCSGIGAVVRTLRSDDDRPAPSPNSATGPAKHHTDPPTTTSSANIRRNSAVPAFGRVIGPIPRRRGSHGSPGAGGPPATGGSSRCRTTRCDGVEVGRTAAAGVHRGQEPVHATSHRTAHRASPTLPKLQPRLPPRDGGAQSRRRGDEHERRHRRRPGHRGPCTQRHTGGCPRDRWWCGRSERRAAAGPLRQVGARRRLRTAAQRARGCGARPAGARRHPTCGAARHRPRRGPSLRRSDHRRRGDRRPPYRHGVRRHPVRRPAAHGSAVVGHHRTDRRPARRTRAVRALGPRRRALPVLLRLRGATAPSVCWPSVLPRCISP